MLSPTSILALASLTTSSLAAYSLVDDYTSKNIFDEFTFLNEPDPSEGYVTYVDKDTATSMGLISNKDSLIYMGVDHNNVASGSGRNSVRIHSPKTYNTGLIIADIQHMPDGICGTWPALWTVGSTWPDTGEVDIIEGIHDQTTNTAALHTSDGCDITDNGKFSGTIDGSDCAASESADGGCGISSSDTKTYGVGFNDVNGGVYATEINADAVTIWFFPRSSIPSDITSGSPNPDNWSTPMAQFQGNCDIATHIKNQKIILNTSFCGTWASNAWASNSGCASKADTCNAYVQNYPADFADAYWSLNYIRVYQDS